MLRIIKGRVVDPVTGTDEILNIECENGKLTYIGRDSSGKVSERTIDAGGMIVMPGLCDIHSHFRDPGFTHKEDIFTGADCAMRGGYTDIVLMANTKPCVDNIETLEYVLGRGSRTPINIYSCANVTKGMAGTELTDFDELFRAGAVGFTDDGVPIMDEAVLKSAFEKAASLGVPVSLHEEDKSYIKENGINHGRASNHYGVYGSPREAESSLIERDVRLAAQCGVKMDVQHISSREGVEAVRKARATYPGIYAEVTPHHLVLTEDAVVKYGANAKMNPPLRTEDDRLALIEGIKDGTITIVATDHAPHAHDEKMGNILKAPSGIIGLETAFSLCHAELVEKEKLPLIKVVSLFTSNPRDLYGLKNEGLKEGASADITIFAPDEEWVYEKSVSKSENSPFLGRKLKGKIKYTISKGETVYEDV